MKIFIADDSVLVCKRLVNLLENLAGVTIVGLAHDAPDALRSIERLKPDAVILDISMPNGSGIDVLHKLKSEKPAPLIIMLTNYSFPQYRRKCMDAGADYFFDKSTEFEKVVDVFNELELVEQT